MLWQDDTSLCWLYPPGIHQRAVSGWRDGLTQGHPGSSRGACYCLWMQLPAAKLHTSSCSQWINRHSQAEERRGKYERRVPTRGGRLREKRTAPAHLPGVACRAEGQHLQLLLLGVAKQIDFMTTLYYWCNVVLLLSETALPHLSHSWLFLFLYVFSAVFPLLPLTLLGSEIIGKIIIIILQIDLASKEKGGSKVYPLDSSCGFDLCKPNRELLRCWFTTKQFN